MKRLKFRVAYATQTGRAHLRQDRGCDDSCAVVVQRKSHAVAVLADGAGSASHGGVGARVVTQCITSAVKQGVTDPIALVEMAREALCAESKRIPCSLEALATTVLVAELRRKKKRFRLRLAHLGDGVVVAQDGSRLFTASQPTRGEHANETVFLSMPQWRSCLRLSEFVLMESPGVLLMSDGPMDCLHHRQSGEPAPACQMILDWGRQLRNPQFQQVLSRNLEQVIAKATQDDCSLACVAAVWR